MEKHVARVIRKAAQRGLLTGVFTALIAAGSFGAVELVAAHGGASPADVTASPSASASASASPAASPSPEVEESPTITVGSPSPTNHGDEVNDAVKQCKEERDRSEGEHGASGEHGHQGIGQCVSKVANGGHESQPEASESPEPSESPEAAESPRPPESPEPSESPGS